MNFQSNLGETDLNQLIDSFDETPEKLKEPYFDGELDTGETLIHLLAKEGCTELLQKLLDLNERPKIEKSKLVEALLMQDKAGWTPLMSSVKADRNVDEIVKMFLEFLEAHSNTSDVEKIFSNEQVMF